MGFTRIADDVLLLEVPFTEVWTGVVLVQSDTPVLVDSGAARETVDSSIVPALAELGMTLDDIHAVLATHIHGDHVGGIGRMRELSPSLKVGVLAESDERMRDPLAYSRQIRAKFPAHSAAAPAVLDGVAADLLLADGDMVGPLQVLHTPGHDTDACCFLDTRTGTLITGDSLQLNGTITQGCSLLFDPARYRTTLERLLTLPIENIVCGHPYLPLGPTAIGAAASRAYLAACLACYEHDRVFVETMARPTADAADGPTAEDIEAIARALVDSVGGVMPGKLFLPMHTVAAYLAAARS